MVVGDVGLQGVVSEPTSENTTEGGTMRQTSQMNAEMEGIEENTRVIRSKRLQKLGNVNEKVQTNAELLTKKRNLEELQKEENREALKAGAAMLQEAGLLHHPSPSFQDQVPRIQAQPTVPVGEA